MNIPLTGMVKVLLLVDVANRAELSTPLSAIQGEAASLRMTDREYKNVRLSNVILQWKDWNSYIQYNLDDPWKHYSE